ncbi:TMEM165/GDT1 family protein (plasmid) [Halorientalis pallida]|uniref:TMEM165/GDT1 family protein n=1 Tax=Halorientalis pallida TaxID=2479928 RepID=UPI003C6FBA6C
MSGFLEIMVIAMTAQLAVLPGEKVQFLISGLSTRYNPLVVVSAAGTAFAGWTALEIWFGQAVKGALPGVYLDAITAVLFLFFAAALWRSAPAPDEQPMDTDGGVDAVEGYKLPVVGTVPETFGSFLPIFSMMAVGEFGDKTQLVTIGLALQYGAHPAIWAGEMLAIIPVSLANAVFFYRFSHRFDLRKAHFFGAGLFAFFGLDTVLSITVGFSIWEQVVRTVSTAVISLL